MLPYGEEGIARIAAERRRHFEVEGWTREHDLEQHTDGELALAAALYATPKPLFEIRVVQDEDGASMSAFDPWPWMDWEEPGRGGPLVAVPAWDKRRQHSRIRALEIAGALCAAALDLELELERRQKAEREEADHLPGGLLEWAVRQFVDERCILGHRENCRARELYEAYRQWLEPRGIVPARSGTFFAMIHVLYKAEGVKNADMGLHYEGLGLRKNQEDQGPMRSYKVTMFDGLRSRVVRVQGFDIVQALQSGTVIPRQVARVERLIGIANTPEDYTTTAGGA
jgi:hypothetical protein